MNPGRCGGTLRDGRFSSPEGPGNPPAGIEPARGCGQWARQSATVDPGQEPCRCGESLLVFCLSAYAYIQYIVCSELLAIRKFINNLGKIRLSIYFDVADWAILL